MSRENVEVVRQALLRVDPTGRFRFNVLDDTVQDGLLELLDDQVEFYEDPRFPEAGVYRGIASVREYFNSFKASFDRFDFEIEEIIDAGEDRVLWLVSQYARGAASGVEIALRTGWVLTVRNGKVIHVRPYAECEEALKALGLQV